MAVETFIGLRTHYIDEGIRRLAHDLGEAVPCEFAILLDETNGPQDTGDLPVLSVSNAALDRLDLLRECDAPTWRCGDYALYLALERFPHCRYFWMIEPDVRINFEHPADFFSLYADDSADLLAAHFRIASQDWAWRESMAGHARMVHQCLFAAVRLSRSALAHLLPERQRLRSTWRPGSAWPNDEAFVATVLANGGYRCRDLNDCGRAVYSPGTFSFDRPIPRSEFEVLPIDRQIYHPVLSGERLFRKILQGARFGRRDVDEAKRMVKRLVDQEWCADDAVRYLEEIETTSRPVSMLSYVQTQWRRWSHRE